MNDSSLDSNIPNTPKDKVTSQDSPPFLPPTLPPTPVPTASSLAFLIKKMGGGKVVSAMFGMLLLAGGVGAGIVLVSQPQLLEQQAQQVNYGLPCSNRAVKSGTFFCAGAVTCKLCLNGRNVTTDRSQCPRTSSCYYVPPAGLANPCYKSQVDLAYSQTQFSGCGIWKNGCSQAVTATILCEKMRSQLNPAEVNVNYYNSHSMCVGTTVDAVQGALSSAGVKYTVYNTIDGPITISGVKNNLREGKKVMLLCDINGVEGHWTLADSINSNGEVVLSDPLFGDGNILGKTENINMSTCKSMIAI